jgi:hypothetical protein
MSDLETRLDKVMKGLDEMGERPAKPDRSPCPRCFRYTSFIWDRGQWVRAGHARMRGVPCERSSKPDGLAL